MTNSTIADQPKDQYIKLFKRPLSEFVSSAPFQRAAEKLYGADSARQDTRYQGLISFFKEKFEYEPKNSAEIISSPGRIEVIGNHTDHQNGEVITASVPLDTIGVMVPTHDTQVRIRSMEFPEDDIVFDLFDLRKKETDSDTAKLAKGVLHYLSLKKYKLSGFDLALTSDVAAGSGLSSSASVEMLLGEVIQAMRKSQGKNEIPLAVLAKAGQYAENEYWGKGSGLMDQFGCGHGGGIHMNIADKNQPAIEPVSLDLAKYGYSVVLIHTHSSHAAGSDEYSRVPSEMREIAALLGKETLNASSLQDLITAYETNPEKFEGKDRAVLRAFHYYREIERVHDAKDGLLSGDISKFLAAINGSGESSLKLLQNGYDIKDHANQKIPLTIEMIRLYMETNAPEQEYGVRLHGGGFGGTVTLYAPTEIAEKYVDHVNQLHEKGAPSTAQLLTVRQEGLVNVTDMARAEFTAEEAPSFPTFYIGGRELEPQIHSIRNGQIRVTTSTVGASIMRIAVPDQQGTVANIVLGTELPEDYLHNPFFLGSTVGRYANRIGGASFSIDGQLFQIPPNEGANLLHGGAGGFHRVKWDVVSKGDGHIQFMYVSKDGDQGFPGELTVLTDMSVNDKSELIITYTASVEGSPTIVNLTNHSYFNLQGNSGTFEKNMTVRDHVLQLFADSYTPTDEAMVPTGVIAPVSETYLDYRNGKLLEDELKSRRVLDHNFVVRGEAGILRPAARLSHQKTGRVLEVETTCPGIQIYTGNFLKSDKGRYWPKHGGICLETQAFPDAPNKANFPSVILRPGEVYRESTVYRFSVQS